LPKIEDGGSWLRRPKLSKCVVEPHKKKKRVKKVNVKCTLVQALRLCTGRTAHGGSRDIALPFLDHGTRRE
jgi:hypothetical protein